MPTLKKDISILHIHRSLRSSACFWIRMKFSFRGHSCGFTPFTGSHFPSRGLNRAGHDNSFTAGPLTPGTILILMYSQSLQKWYVPIYNLLPGRILRLVWSLVWVRIYALVWCDRPAELHGRAVGYGGYARAPRNGDRFPAFTPIFFITIKISWYPRKRDSFCFGFLPKKRKLLWVMMTGCENHDNDCCLFF